MCDRLAVMYLGRVVEEADTEELFSNPQHPYTKALLSATPSFDKKKEKIMILGDVPSPINYLDESKAKLATEITEQEKLEISAIEGKGIDYIVRSSLNEVVPLVEIPASAGASVTVNTPVTGLTPRPLPTLNAPRVVADPTGRTN